ncbi:anti-sigma B factor RsbW [Parageobacillus sp. VR-IP]|uniref:anti-sigma B factor RsbW n=1 Tax=Parageobacillus sp. VR-IP TaxID=2742205 RepID=UPI0015823EDD|nr:anti-sigma B factor RsbW [Parageobacillus sp. VR-IP]NUK29997.1 anti-sigma B factor RsbW [Parageobacillus sp. VR-IP]
MKEFEQVVQLSIPAKAEFIDLARLSLYGVAAKMGFSYEDIEDMKVAVSEACNNVVLHAYDDEPGRIDLRFEMQPDAIRIIVKDYGKSFNYEQEAKQAASLHHQSLDAAKIGGLGLFMMQALMDQVEVLTIDGTEVILTKFLNRNEGEHNHEFISSSSIQEQP